jgi:hypothetical protein
MIEPVALKDFLLVFWITAGIIVFGGLMPVAMRSEELAHREACTWSAIFCMEPSSSVSLSSIARSTSRAIGVF